MLIDSQRLKPGDREAWRKAEEVDHLLAGRYGYAEGQAIDDIRSFAGGGPCYVSVSWGKDSVVVADLAMRSGLTLPLVRATWPPWDNPECEPVRDAFLERWPSAEYHEVAKEGAPEGDGKDDWSEVLARFGERRITGIRAQESPSRKIRCRSHGLSSKNTCAPIGWWRTDRVFSYLYDRNLPVSACYAMTMGGRLQRDRLRVDALCGDRGSWFGRDEWERVYFGDVIARARGE